MFPNISHLCTGLCLAHKTGFEANGAHAFDLAQDFVITIDLAAKKELAREPAEGPVNRVAVLRGE